MFLEQKLLPLLFLPALLALAVIALVFYVFYITLKKKPKSKLDQMPKKETSKKISELEKKQVKENNRKKRVLLLSRLGITKSKDYFPNIDEHGILACGVVFDSRSKVYFYSPNGNVLHPGDVVSVIDTNNVERIVAVILGNSYINQNEVLIPLRNIEKVIYVYNENDFSHQVDQVISNNETINEEIQTENDVSLEKETIETANVNTIKQKNADILCNKPLVEQNALGNAEKTTEKEVETVVDVSQVNETTEEESDSEEENSVEFDDKEKIYRIITYKKTFAAKAHLLSDEVKDYLSLIYNKLLSFDAKIYHSKQKDTFKINKKVCAIVKLTNSGIKLFLNLNPNELSNSKYKGKDLSEKKTMEYTPFCYSFKTRRKAIWATELIDKMAIEQNYQIVQYETIDMKKIYPMLSLEELMEKELVTKKVIESTTPPKNFLDK